MLNNEKGDRARIQSFELWAYRRLLRINWTEKRSNKSVLDEIGETKRLVNEIEQQKLQLIGHVMSSGVARSLLLGGAKRKRSEHIWGPGAWPRKNFWRPRP